MIPTEVIAQCLLFPDFLDELVIEFVPLVANLHKIVVVTRLRLRTLMNQHRIKFVNLLVAIHRPRRKVELLLVFEGGKNLDVMTTLKVILKPFELNHQNRRKIRYFYAFVNLKIYLCKLTARHIPLCDIYFHRTYELLLYMRRRTQPVSDK